MSAVILAMFVAGPTRKNTRAAAIGVDAVAQT